MDFSKGFITANYRDGSLFADGNDYPAGHFTLEFMNHFYDNDLAGRLCVYFGADSFLLARSMDDGIIDVTEYLRVGRKIMEGLKFLPLMKPFDQVDVDALRDYAAKIFTENIGEQIRMYFRARGVVAAYDQGEVSLGLAHTKVDRLGLRGHRLYVEEIVQFIKTLERLADDIIKTHEVLVKFLDMEYEAERFDEAHLLPIALEITGEPELPLTVQYISMPKSQTNDTPVLGRRMTFSSFYSFLMTDFYEGLHHGHYLRQCPICKQYFLMESARWQVYCDGYAPEEYRGKRLTCKKYAAAMGYKELAEGDPVLDLYRRRCSAIRAEKSRGTIDPNFAKAAIALARNRKLRAMKADDYAAEQYETDLSREKLYADVTAGKSQ